MLPLQIFPPHPFPGLAAQLLAALSLELFPLLPGLRVIVSGTQLWSLVSGGGERWRRSVVAPAKALLFDRLGDACGQLLRRRLLGRRRGLADTGPSQADE